MKKVQIIVILLLGFAQVNGQPKDSFFLWGEFYLNYHLNPSFVLGGDAGFRELIGSNTSRTVIYVRPKGTYKINNTFSASLSVGAFQNYNEIVSNVFEIRPTQELKVSWPNLSWVGAINHFRMEERYLTTASNSSNLNRDNTWEFRARYILKLKTVTFDLLNLIHNFYVVSSVDLFLPLDNRFSEVYANRSRFTMGFGQLLNKKWNYEVDFVWQKSKSEVNNDFVFDQFILRLRLFHHRFQR